MTMATNFKTDFKNSRNWFSRFVVPALREFGFDNVISVEKHDSKLECSLDFAGVDALATDKDGATMTLASRVIEVKPYGKDYDCFSLRDSRSTGYQTEFEKLKRAIEKNSLRPMWHCQTFVDLEKETATCSIVRTNALVQFLDVDNPKTKATSDGTTFRLAPWQDLIRAGVKVTTIKIGVDGKKITA